MSKELKVVYRDFKAKYSVIPNEIVLQPKYNRAKKKADDLINHIYHYKIKNNNGLDLDVVELKYYKKLVKIINLMAEELATPVHSKKWVIDYFTNKVEEDK